MHCSESNLTFKEPSNIAAGDIFLFFKLISFEENKS